MPELHQYMLNLEQT